MALIVTLVMTAILTAMTVEFVYGVYVSTGFLENWTSMSGLMQSARSGMSVAGYLLRKNVSGKAYTYPGRVTTPPVDPFMDGSSAVALTIEDLDGRFEINTLVYENGEPGEAAMDGFARMVDHLMPGEGRGRELADRVADWIDPDSLPRAADSEKGVRNGPLQGVDELLLVPGLDQTVYDKVSAYVTVRGSGLVNINAAETPVLMTLSDDMTEELAGRIVSWRALTPFEATSDLAKVAGFETLGISLIGAVSVKGTAFLVTSEAATPEGLTARIEAVMDSSGKVQYWKEH
jgi:general secretion pathway protein K